MAEQTWKVAVSPHESAGLTCGFEELSLDLGCINKNLNFEPVNDPRKVLATQKSWSHIVYRTEFPTNPEIEQLKFPGLLIGFVKGHHFVYLNDRLIHQVNVDRSFSYTSINSSLLKPLNRLTIIVKHSKELYPGLYSSYTPYIAETEAINTMLKRDADYIEVRPWFFILTKVFLIMASLILFTFSERRPELFVLALFVSSTLFINIEQPEWIRNSTPSLLRFKFVHLSYILPQLFLGLFVLSYFRYARVWHVRYTIFFFAISSVQIYSIALAENADQLQNTLKQWTTFQLPVFGAVFFSICLFSVERIRIHFGLRHRVILGYSFLVATGFTSFLAWRQLSSNLAIQIQSGSLPYEGLIDLGIVAFMAIVPFVEMIISEWRRYEMEEKTQAIINLILDGVHGNLYPYLDTMLEKTCQLLRARRGSILLKIQSEGKFRFVTRFGETSPDIVGKIPKDGDFSNQYVHLEDPKPLAISNLKYTKLDQKLFNLNHYNSPSFIAVPLRHEGKVFGAIFVSDPVKGRNWYNHLDLYGVEIIATKLADEIFKAYQHDSISQFNRQLENNNRRLEQTHTVLMDVIEDTFIIGMENMHKDDRDTPGHTGLVRKWSIKILEKLLQLDLVDQLKLGSYEDSLDVRSNLFRVYLDHAAIFHDIGKKEVPIEILAKPGKLDWPREVLIMRGHALASYYILKGKKRSTGFNRAKAIEAYQKEHLGGVDHCNVNYLTDFFKPTLQSIPPNFEEVSPNEMKAIIAASHQEHFDGGGYPFALKEDQIPLIGRILCIADSMAVMKLRDVYKERRTWQWIWAEVGACSGTQFDPVLVTAALSFIEETAPQKAATRIQHYKEQYLSRGVSFKDVKKQIETDGEGFETEPTEDERKAS